MNKQRMSFLSLMLFLVLASDLVAQSEGRPKLNIPTRGILKNKDVLAPAGIKKKKTQQQELIETERQEKSEQKKEENVPKGNVLKGEEKVEILEASETSSCLKSKGKGPYKLDFNKADIIDIVKFISELTCKNFIIPDNLRQGKITIMSPEPVSAEEVYRAFLSALEVNKITIVPAGKYLKLMGQRESISSTIPTVIGDEKYPIDDRMITKIVRVKYVDPNTLLPTLKQLASKDGDIFLYAPTNSLIISDTGNNLYRLEKIMEELDRPGFVQEIYLYTLNYAVASQIAEKLNNIFDVKGGQGGPPTPTFRPASTLSERQSQTKDKKEDEELRISKIIADDRTNKLIIIATRRSFEDIVEVIKKLDVPVPGEGQVHVYYLQYADADQLANTLSQLAQGYKGARGTSGPKPATPAPSAPGASAELFQGEIKITADKATNSLLIIANQNDYKNLVKVIEKLDVRRRQVFVEAVIMEVSLDKRKSGGMAFNVGMGMEYDGQKFPVFAGTILGGLNSLVLEPSSLAQLGGFISGAQGPPVEGVELGGATKITLPSFGVILRALQASSDVNVLSTPHILTTDNEDAEILVGQNIPYQAGFTSTLGGTNLTSWTPIVSIQRQDVALKMKIKPQINQSDYVKLNIEQEVSEVAGTDPLLGPTTTKRSAKTVVVVKDQQTVAIGGLMRDNQSVSISKVPILGDIPIIGWFFKSKETKTTKTNLLLFLTPYIISDKDDFRRIFERKMRERKEFIERFYGVGAEFDIYIDYNKKHGPFFEMNKRMNMELSKFENGGRGSGDEILITPDTDLDRLKVDMIKEKQEEKKEEIKLKDDLKDIKDENVDSGRIDKENNENKIEEKQEHIEVR
ncbi:MAG: type II secretion system secretin GspD [Deltaproteobacteria bacterium]|nr:type II secretion system secretin GspD [Deltaproteobacteria bacterium]